MKNVAQSSRANIRLLMAFAKSHGWCVSRTQSGHIRFTEKGMPTIFTSSTPSDCRSDLNAKAQLRRADRQVFESFQEAL